MSLLTCKIQKIDRARFLSESWCAASLVWRISLATAPQLKNDTSFRSSFLSIKTDSDNLIRWQQVVRWEPPQNSVGRTRFSEKVTWSPWKVRRILINVGKCGRMCKNKKECGRMWKDAECFAEFLNHSACFREIALSPSACSTHYSAIMAEAAANSSVQEDTVTKLCWWLN